MSEQEPVQTTPAVQVPQTGAGPHPEAVGKRWGDHISVERQAELQGYLDRWAAETDHGVRKGPFDAGPGNLRMVLTGADVYWLWWVLSDEEGDATDLRLEEVNLRGADLAGAQFWRAHLEYADLQDAKLENSFFRGAHLENASLYGANLRGANLYAAYLQGADLSSAHLEDASFFVANLAGARLGFAHLDNANLRSAQLEGAYLEYASLTGAHLSGARLDGKTRLNEATLNQDTVLADVQWGGVGSVNLTQINWSAVSQLGDEHRPPFLAQAPNYELAVRAYRQVAAQLRAQGLNEVADRFIYRAQVCQRRALRSQGIKKFPAYLGSLLLAALSGYGYRIWRIFAAYVLIVGVFAAIYFLLGIPKDPGTNVQDHAFNALLVSLTAIHRRVFFEQFNFTVQAWVAAVESIVGIVIEGVFVAMLIQRFFAR